MTIEKSSDQKREERKSALKYLKNVKGLTGNQWHWHQTGIGEGKSNLICNKCGNKVKRLFYGKKGNGICGDCQNK